MRKIFIFLFLFYTLPSFADLNNKGIICECVICKLNSINVESYVEEQKYPSEIGYFFLNDKVSRFFIKETDGQIFFFKNDFNKFESDLDIYNYKNTIEWGSLTGVTYRYILDKDTLILNKKFNPTDTINVIRQCNVYESSYMFKKKLEDLVSKYQKNYNSR